MDARSDQPAAALRGRGRQQPLGRAALWAEAGAPATHRTDRGCGRGPRRPRRDPPLRRADPGSARPAGGRGRRAGVDRGRALRCPGRGDVLRDGGPLSEWGSDQRRPRGATDGPPGRLEGGRPGGGARRGPGGLVRGLGGSDPVVVAIERGRRGTGLGPRRAVVQRLPRVLARVGPRRRASPGNGRGVGGARRRGPRPGNSGDRRLGVEPGAPGSRLRPGPPGVVPRGRRLRVWRPGVRLGRAAPGLLVHGLPA